MDVEDVGEQVRLIGEVTASGVALQSQAEGVST